MTRAPLSHRFDEALCYAHELHRDQVRKGTAIPYVSHLLAVASVVLEHNGTEDQAIAALLHDGPEDQGGEATLAEIRVRFGDNVAAIVADCTDAWTEPKPPWKARKEQYIAALAQKRKASLLVSLADKTHNAEAILFDFRDIGDELWARFNGGADGTCWYYGELARTFKTVLPGRLTDRLCTAVAAFTASRADALISR